MKSSPDWAELGLAAMRRAAKGARQEAARLGLEIPVWKDGRIVYEYPAIDGIHPSSAIRSIYTIFDHGQTRQGDACAILETIRFSASKENEEIRQMDVEQYADVLIEDAPYFLDADILKALGTQPFDSKFDRALSYLAQMPTSGIRILTMQAA